MLSGAGSPACAMPKVVRKSIVTTVFLMALPFDQGLRHDFLPTGGAVLYTMTAASCDQFTWACHWEQHGQCGRSGAEPARQAGQIEVLLAVVRPVERDGEIAVELVLRAQAVRQVGGGLAGVAARHDALEVEVRCADADQAI